MGALFMIEVRAADFGSLCAFYRDVLGLPEATRDEAGGFAMFGRREPYVAVVKKHAGAAAGPSRVVPDFVVGDLDGALEALAARGVPVIAPPSASPEGYRIATIEDPEGNSIHLFEWLPGARPPA